MDGWKRSDASSGAETESRSIEHDARPTDSADGAEYVVRRLTPTECARLQGFPSDFVADIPHSDSAEYKMWGNGIALPCIIPMMKAMGDKINGN